MQYVIGLGSCLLLVIGFYWLAWRAGKKSEQAQEGQRDVDAAKRIADSESNAPVDLDDLRRRLRGGTRRL